LKVNKYYFKKIFCLMEAEVLSTVFSSFQTEQKANQIGKGIS